ncbi:LysR family transcriptional regulator [Salmonella enterica subsp. enterica]|nr:LysR family transcriptional regulator [Salmonella enterica subsp. enterica] [Salmonella enterica subsp. enterica serovar Menston]
MIKTDLNDFAWFVHVVEEGGFAAAGVRLMNQNQN